MAERPAFELEPYRLLTSCLQGLRGDNVCKALITVPAAKQAIESKW